MRRTEHDAPAVPAPLVALAVPGTPPLTAAGLARIAPLLPPNGRRDQQWRDHRTLVAGMLWVMRAGASWRELPPEYGAWQTCYDRYTRWRRDGTWQRILAALTAPPRQLEPSP